MHCSPWGREESGMTEQLHFHSSFSCIGEGNGNPLQCSCLENPRDAGAWWAVIYGVAQDQTRLKRLSSSSSQVRKLKIVCIAYEKKDIQDTMGCEKVVYYVAEPSHPAQVSGPTDHTQC